MKYLVLSLLLLTSCSTTTPNRYGEYVKVVKGTYKDQVGRLIGDCSGFENYMVELSLKRVCISIWDLEKLYK